MPADHIGLCVKPLAVEHIAILAGYGGKLPSDYHDVIPRQSQQTFPHDYALKDVCVLKTTVLIVSFFPLAVACLKRGNSTKHLDRDTQRHMKNHP
eukprot:5876079-Amphidinium_carterae.2